MSSEEQRKHFKQDALAAWIDYQTSGLHLTGEEMDMWFKRVIAGDIDGEPPHPHR